MLNFSWPSSAFYFANCSLHLHPHYCALFSMTSKAQYRTSFMVFLCVLFGTHWLCTLDWAEGFWSMMIWWWWTLEHWSFFMSLTFQFRVPPTPSSSFLNIQRQTKAINAIWPTVTDQWPSMDVTSAEPTGEVRRVRFGLSLRHCDQSIVILVHCIGEFMMTLCHCVIVIVTFSLWIENGWARLGGPPVNPTKLNLLTVPRFGWICFSPAF